MQFAFELKCINTKVARAIPRKYSGNRSFGIPLSVIKQTAVGFKCWFGFCLAHYGLTEFSFFFECNLKKKSINKEYAFRGVLSAESMNIKKQSLFHTHTRLQIVNYETAKCI